METTPSDCTCAVSSVIRLLALLDVAGCSSWLATKSKRIFFMIETKGGGRCEGEKKTIAQQTCMIVVGWGHDRGTQICSGQDINSIVYPMQRHGG